MMKQRWRTISSVCLVLFLGGCSGPVGLYHAMEGGAIAQKRQPPPGLNLPYPNLADVPPAPAPTPPDEAARIAARARQDANNGMSAPASGALAGLTLPAGPIPAAPPKPAQTSAATPPKLANPPPVPLAFAAHTALLAHAQIEKLRALAARRGQADILVCGFGDGDLALALARARRLADALTAAGVPGRAIRISAMAAGSGGFAQLVY